MGVRERLAFAADFGGAGWAGGVDRLARSSERRPGPPGWRIVKGMIAGVRRSDPASETGIFLPRLGFPGHGAGSDRRCCFRPAPRFGRLSRGGEDRARPRPGRGGNLLDLPLDGAERREDQIDQTDQERGQPCRAAVRGQALRDLAELCGEALLGGVGRRGRWVHARCLEHKVNAVKRNVLVSGRLERGERPRSSPLVGFLPVRLLATVARQSG